MDKIIPAELLNSQALRKMKTLYAEQVREHGEECALLIQMRRDIETIERDLQQDEPLFATHAAHAAL